jgi:nitrilase
MAKSKTLRVGIAQIAPVYYNTAESLARAIEIIQQAADKGVELVVFGETWFSGYPAWLDVCPSACLWDHEPTKQIFAELRENSLVMDGPEVSHLVELSRDLRITIVAGINERVDDGPGQGTLYNSLITITPQDGVAVHHRKLMPTFTERIVWGQGDGNGLHAAQLVSAQADKVRVGGLICWEHWMPLVRFAMHESGEHIHVAMWPTAHEKLQLASRHYALEGRCFVLASGLMMKTADLPVGLAHEVKEEWVERGGSAIIAPDGSYVVEPVYDREELIVADLDPTMIDRERMNFDVTGHYSRPDIFRFSHAPLPSQR